jgi:hypothetical protein
VIGWFLKVSIGMERSLDVVKNGNTWNMVAAKFY